MAGSTRAGAEVMMFDTLGANNRDVGTPTKILSESSAKHGMVVIEVGPLLAASPERGRFVCLDGIHMTEPYHRLMAREWLKYLAGARGAKLTGKGIGQ